MDQGIYQALDSLRKELKGDISAASTSLSSNFGRLEQKFDNLEQGRLADAEKDINSLKVSRATTNVKLVVIGFIGSTVAGALVSALVTKAIS